MRQQPEHPCFLCHWSVRLTHSYITLLDTKGCKERRAYMERREMQGGRRRDVSKGKKENFCWAWQCLLHLFMLYVDWTKQRLVLCASNSTNTFAEHDQTMSPPMLFVDKEGYPEISNYKCTLLQERYLARKAPDCIKLKYPKKLEMLYYRHVYLISTSA